MHLGVEVITPRLTSFVRLRTLRSATSRGRQRCTGPGWDQPPEREACQDGQSAPERATVPAARPTWVLHHRTVAIAAETDRHQGRYEILAHVSAMTPGGSRFFARFVCPAVPPCQSAPRKKGAGQVRDRPNQMPGSVTLQSVSRTE